MKRVAVITGGAGGMGLATARLLGRDHHPLLCDVNPRRLESARAELQAEGIGCDVAVCDITDAAAVNALLQQARGLGHVSSVVHTAGLSPQMAAPDVILKVNALGTIHITNACYEVAGEGFALVNLASMSAHMLPNWMLPVRAYRHAFTDPQRLLGSIGFRCKLLPSDFARRGIAYSISKNFVVWYTKRCAAKFGAKGARILSISPGTIDTEMGRLEEKSGAMKIMQDKAALKRPGQAQEIAQLAAFCVSDQAAYITGIDILCDGGVIASQTR